MKEEEEEEDKEEEVVYAVRRHDKSLCTQKQPKTKRDNNQMATAPSSWYWHCIVDRVAAAGNSHTT